MADTAIAITAGTGTNVDTRTEATNGNHRQVIVIGDPATNAGVAPVDATTGLSVNVTNASIAAAATLAAETTKVIGTVNNAAGTNLMGKVGIDQTTDGTTNKVAADVRLGGVAASTGSGVMGTGTQRVAMATDSPGIIATGTAGSASSTVLTVQGIAGATPQPVGGVTVTQAASSTITRPADTTAYASGDLVANSVTAGSVANLQFTTLARVSGGSGVIIGAQIQKSTASATNAAFRLHLFNTAPTYTSAGDNSALSTVVVASAKGYLGYIDITAMVGFSDVCWGSGAPDNTRGGIPYVATAQIIYGLLEARGAYTPGNAEVFTVTVDALQD